MSVEAQDHQVGRAFLDHAARMGLTAPCHFKESLGCSRDTHLNMLHCWHL